MTDHLDNVVSLPNADAAIRYLHEQIELLATYASHAYTPSLPIRIDRHNETYGTTELTYWYDSRNIRVFTVDGCVFISGLLQFAVWPDWQGMKNDDVRRLAQALWSAAAHVERSAKPEV